MNFIRASMRPSVSQILCPQPLLESSSDLLETLQVFLLCNEDVHVF